MTSARPLALLSVLVLLGAGPLAAAEKKAEDPVVAVVDGTKIRLSDVKETRDSLPEQYRAMPLEMLYPGLLGMIIDTKLVAAQGRRDKLNADPVFKERLARIEEQLLENAAIEKHLAGAVTDAAVKTKYDSFVKGFAGKTEIRARHILVDAEDKAVAAIAELKKGADFAELARARSTGPSGPSGGDLGYFAEGQMVPEFSRAAFALEKGKFTEAPVKTQFGWHVIKIEDRRQAKAPPLDEVQQELRTELSRDARLKYVEALRKGAKIERFNPDGTPMKAEDAKPAPKPTIAPKK